MLFPKHAVDREYSFRLFTEKKSAKDFDDIVLRYEQDGKIVHRFIQVKHRQGRHKKISIGDLLTPGKNGAFGLIKYLIAYLKIKSSGEFEGEIKDFFIATNVGFDFESLADKGISFTRMNTEDEFLNIGSSVRYKFDNSIISHLQENMDFIKGEVGGQVSDGEINKKIEEFPDKLVLAVNLPNHAELEGLIKNEISNKLIEKFNYFGNDETAYNALFMKMWSWMKDREGRFLSHKEGEELFRKVEMCASTLSEIRQEVEKGNKEIGKIAKQQRKDSKTLHKIHAVATTQNNKQIEKPIQFNMVYPVEMFVGRDSELQEIYGKLHESTGKLTAISQMVVIGGLGGIGKSELARKYAYEYRKDYDGNVVWVNAENFGIMKNSFLKLAEDDKLGIPPQDKYGNDKTIETIVKEIYAFFARRGRKSLFIFDNAEGYEDISKFLPFSLGQDYNKPCVLITSRSKDWKVGEEEGKIQVIQLDEFTETEALRFVKKALNIRNNLQDEEIKKLTKELQYFPLALGQAVKYINESNIVLSRRSKKKISVRCMVPESDGILSSSFKESLWDRYYMGAPKQHRRFVEQYKIEKRA